MDPPTEIENLEGVDHNASPTDDGGNTPAADAVSMVLADHDLLLQIMLRLGLGLPTALVRAILVCKRWFSVAADPFSLRCFRCQHSPRLLGFYVSTRSTTSHLPLRPRFVPMPPPESDQPPPSESDQPPRQSDLQEQEFAAAVRMAESYSLDAYNEDFACVDDIQNDTMLVSGFCGETFAVQVHWPLSPHNGAVAIPVLPYDPLDGPMITAAHFLLKVQSGRGNGLAYVWLSMGFQIKGKGEYSVKYKAHIYVLQEDGSWRFRASAAAVLPSPKSDSRPLLVGTTIYLSHSTSIAALDLRTSTFSEIPLPEGMEKYDYKTMMLSAYYDAGVCLIHLDEDLQLFIWLHIAGMPSWLPIDAISLPEMFETLGMTGWTDDDEPATLFQAAQMGDFVEFVFLKLGQCALCLDTRRRVLRKVYEVTQEDQDLEQLQPLMMTWPPKFPVLKGDHLARNVS